MNDNVQTEIVASSAWLAGRSIMHCVFGDARSIDVASLGPPDEDNFAEARFLLKPFSGATIAELSEIRDEQSMSSDDFRLLCEKKIICIFASHAAEFKATMLVDPVEDSDWFGRLIEGSSLSEEGQARSLDEADFLSRLNLDDIEIAIALALFVEGPDRTRILKFLSLCADLTDFFLKNPKVWDCVEELAETLRSSQLRFGADIDREFSDRLDGIAADIQMAPDSESGKIIGREFPGTQRRIDENRHPF